MELLLKIPDNVSSVTTFIVIGYVILFIHRWYRLRARLPPACRTGLSAALQGATGSNAPDFYLKIVKDIGNKYTLRLFSIPFAKPTIITGDAELARDILMDPSSLKPNMYMEVELNGIGNVFTRNGHFWYSRRKGIVPAFSGKHIQRMSQVALDKTEKWIQEKLMPLSQHNAPFDIGEEMISITLEAICETAFEYDISHEEKEDFIFNSEVQFKEFASRSMLNPLRKFLPHWIIPERKYATECFLKNYQFAYRIIAKYRSNPNPIKGTIIYQIMNNPCYETEDQLASEVLVFLTAGYDTTAYTIAFTLLELARHPQEQKTVREDLFNTAKASSVISSSPATGTIVDQKLWRQSNDLQRAIKESMRLNPVSAGGSVRLCGRDFITKKEGYIIPKGSTVLILPILLHRNQQVYGESTVNNYMPSRWENPTKAQKEHFMIFSAGKQNCVGQALANAELYSIIPRILSEFELSVHDEGSTTFFLTYKPLKAMLKAKRYA